MPDVFRFLKHNFRWIAGGFLLTVFSSFGQTFFISQFSKNIRETFSLSDGQFGMLYMAATLMSALTLIYLGKVLDRYRIGVVAVSVIVALSMACIGMSLATNVVALFFVLFGLRLFGQGMMTHTSQTAIGKWFDVDRGRAISFTTMGHQFGEALLPSIVLGIVTLTSWRQTWLIASATLLAFALPAIYLLLRVERQPVAQTTARKNTNQVRSWTRAEVIRDPVFWGLLLGTLAPAFIGTSVFFHQDHMIDSKQWSREIFASAYIVLAISTITFTLIGGWLVDKYSSKVLLPAFLVPMGLGCILLGVSDATLAIFGFMALLGTSYGISSALFGTLWPETYGTEHLGSIRALAVAAMVFASALGPGLTGWCIDRGIPFSSQLMFMGAYCGLGAIGMCQCAWALHQRS